MHDYQLLHNALFVSVLLFALGTIGFACRRNLVIVLLSAGLMFQAAILALAAFGFFHQQETGERFSLFALAVAAAVGGFAVAMTVLVTHRAGSLDLIRWNRLGHSESESPAGEAPCHPIDQKRSANSVEAVESADCGPRSEPRMSDGSSSAGDSDG